MDDRETGQQLELATDSTRSDSGVAGLPGEGAPRAGALARRPPPRLGGRHAGYVQPDWVRGRIQTGVVLTFLHQVVKGKNQDHPARVKNRIDAARLLLAKSLPDLQTVQLVGDEQQPLVICTRML